MNFLKVLEIANWQKLKGGYKGLAREFLKENRLFESNFD